MDEEYLIEFYGTECVHCKAMRPLAERLEAELNVKIKRYEVWHNADNAKIMQQYDRDFCGGVPFFYNTRTNKWICGSTTYEKFKAWAQGK